MFQSLTRFVRVKGLSISQMIHTSVKTRDWLGALEPRNVRAGTCFNWDILLYMIIFMVKNGEEW